MQGQIGNVCKQRDENSERKSKGNARDQKIVIEMKNAFDELVIRLETAEKNTGA